LARPLLNARRWALREWLRKRGGGWIEDPANANEAFARVRARRTLAALHAAGFEPMRLAALAERLAVHAATLDHAAQMLIRAAAAFHDDTVLITRARWRGDDAVRQRALSALLTAAGGAAGEPPADDVAALEAQLLQFDFKAATLGGAWLRAGADTIAIRRDPGALEGRADGAAPLAPLSLTPGAAQVWDRRAALTVDEAGWRILVEARKPQLARAEDRRPLADARISWLLEERAAHLLGSVNALE
jgi:tRNA(Ile)-lysidine synthase